MNSPSFNVAFLELLVLLLLDLELEVDELLELDESLEELEEVTDSVMPSCDCDVDLATEPTEELRPMAKPVEELEEAVKSLLLLALKL